MLVFISDVHMTDGNSGETIKPTAFRIFAENVRKLADTVKPLEEIRLVLLGDIFDIIRSSQWLSVPARPWDSAGPEQEEIVRRILDTILAGNEDSLAELRGLRQLAAEKEVPFDITYVIGNHDWLINRYPACREAAAKALGLAPGGNLFPSQLFDPEYRVLARHGDIYDGFNCIGDRDASSIGDAIVIELLNKYPEEVKRRLAGLVVAGAVTKAEAERIEGQLRELDNIRPLLDAPSWVLMVATRTENEAAREVIEQAWSACVDDFFRVPFIEDRDRFMWPDTIDLLRIALQLSSHASKKTLEKICELKGRWLIDDEAGGYARHAFDEQAVRSGKAAFVLYGHTHDHVMVPLDQKYLPGGLNQDKVYFNTGTWRKTWNKTKFDTAHREFIGWHVLTYVTIFKPSENGPYNFEVWNAALG